MRLLHALDLDFADGVRHPLGSLRLGGLEEDFGSRLRQHHLGEMAVDGLQLRLTLKAEYKRVFALPVLGNRSVQLRETLQGRQLIEDKPYRRLVLFRGAQQTQNQPVNPET